MIPSLALQQAVFRELNKGDYPVYEIVPSDTNKMPFITLGDLNRSQDFTKTNTDRFTYSIMIHGWSVGQSSRQSKEIEEFIYQELMNLQMDTYEVEFVRLVMNNNLKEEESKDRVIFHSVQQFEITISKAKE